MPPCGMTERAIAQPLRVAPLKTPGKKKNACFRRHFPFYGEVWLACKKFWAGGPAHFTVW